MTFEHLFGISAQVSGQAPGRVNLMGEHTDYNHGFVLPTILPQITTVQLAIDPCADEKIDAFSENYSERIQRRLDTPPDGHWTDYILACLHQLTKRQIAIPSLKIFVQSAIPIGAGVSSSAALEVAMLKAMRDLLQLDLSDVAIALMAQQAESEGVGMPCGVMDQMVSSLGQPNHAFFLDTQDLSFELIPLPKHYQFAVVHSGKSHALVNSGYKKRRQECESAAALLKVSSLRDTSLLAIKQTANLPDTLRQRAMHVVSENQRVLECVAALKDNRMIEFGQLMNASHLSQKEQFAVTIPATDALWQTAIQSGAIGARQTGGGFGGAIVALIPAEVEPSWWDCVSNVCPEASLICMSGAPIKGRCQMSPGLESEV